MNKIYFLSDVHLGAHDDRLEKLKEQRLLSFFRMIEVESADLVIVGDLFDFWFEYKQVVPRKHFRVLGYLALLAAEREIHYLAGNHDFWLNSFMRNEIGLIVHDDEYVLNSSGRRIYMRHGDGLLKNDVGYRFLKRILRNKVNIFLYRLLHPDIGIPFALFFSHLSRNSGEKKSDTYADLDYRHYAFAMIEKEFDIVVLGHTHWAALAPHKHGYYVNPGFWGMNFTYAVVENGVPFLFAWNGQNGVPFSPAIPPGNIKNVK
ncbi:UDP-2,3-diacylglucosamine diphosphatase [candidate division KSB1 bacterium]|nr:UDP-2,3-diacylglucosamine diphosphatase [candidate division KSB1 bacterium]RQV99909.1 MAG: UDP-2,3-diacylglucosamine diphosphatase [candidate division KSB1 bacterium]